jgi:hypothetical protein
MHGGVGDGLKPSLLYCQFAFWRRHRFGSKKIQNIIVGTLETPYSRPNDCESPSPFGPDAVKLSIPLVALVPSSINIALPQRS